MNDYTHFTRTLNLVASQLADFVGAESYPPPYLAQKQIDKAVAVARDFLREMHSTCTCVVEASSNEDGRDGTLNLVITPCEYHRAIMRRVR